MVCINRYNDIDPDSVLKAYCISCSVHTAHKYVMPDVLKKMSSIDFASKEM